jgi:hypothetical protein
MERSGTFKLSAHRVVLQFRQYISMTDLSTSMMGFHIPLFGQLIARLGIINALVRFRFLPTPIHDVRNKRHENNSSNCSSNTNAKF